MRSIKEIEDKVLQLKEKLRPLPLTQAYGDIEMVELKDFMGYDYSYPVEWRLKVLELQDGFIRFCSIPMI